MEPKSLSHNKRIAAQSGKNKIRRAVRAAGRPLATAGMSLFLTFCGPATETIVSPNKVAHAQESKPQEKKVLDFSSMGYEEIESAPEEKTGQGPFALNDRMRELIRKFNSGSDMAKVNRLFAELHKGAPNGVTVEDMTNKPPRTAAEALSRGGDCTDLANIVIPMLKEMGVPGGVLLVHFKNAPKGVDHLVPYLEIGGKKTIIDLQTTKLGKTAQGPYSIILDLTYNEASSTYYREWGDYHKGQGKKQDAIAAYEKSLEIYEENAYVHQNLGELYEDTGQKDKAIKHWARAAELDPSYKKHGLRAYFNEQIRLGSEAFNEGRYADCAKHFQNALNTGIVKAKDKKPIEQNRDLCREKAE